MAGRLGLAILWPQSHVWDWCCLAAGLLSPRGPSFSKRLVWVFPEGQHHKRAREETERHLKAWAWKSHSVTSAVFCWSKEVTRLAHVPGVGKYTSAVNGRNDNVPL